MPELIRDLRYAARALRRSPGFTGVAVLTLALGIGANTAIFSLVDGILLSRLPYPEPERLVDVSHLRMDTGESTVVSPGNAYSWGREAASFEALSAYDRVSRTLADGAGARQVSGVRAAGDLFGVLKVPPSLGRTFTAEEDAPGAAPVIVLSRSLSRELFGEGGDPLGRPVTLDGTAYTVVGVMPPSFAFPDPTAAFWIPARFDAELRTSRTEQFLKAVGRLTPGATPEGAGRELAALMDRAREEYPQANAGLSATAAPLKDELVGEVRPVLLLLMGAVAGVLLIACLNIANLMLARFSGRQREIGVRRALGAGRVRIARQVAAEGVVLGLIGGVLGLWLATLLVDALLLLLPLELPRVEAIRVDRGVLAFTTFTALAAGLLASLLPAIRAASRAPAGRLRDRSGDGSEWMRRSLVVVEVLVAVVLVAGSTLLARSALRLQAESPGFDAQGLLALDVRVPGSYDMGRRVAFYRDLEARLETESGVGAASFTTILPTESGGSAAWINLLDRPPPAGEPPFVEYRVVGPDFTAVLGLPLVRGRLPRPDVSRAGPAEVLIDEVVADRFWPEGNPIGRQITLGPDGGWIPPATIVGIVAPAKGESLRDAAPGLLYVPHALTPWWTAMTVVARVPAGDPLALAPAARRAVAALDASVPVLEVSTVWSRVRGSAATERSLALLLGLFAVLALVLAAVGLAGVLAYGVARRTRELGIRVALGADPGGVRRMVVQQALGLVIAGLLPGVVAALALSRLVRHWLFQTPPHDAASYLAAGVVLLAVGALASWGPARRATRVDPAEALRSE